MFAARTKAMKSSTIREALNLASDPDLISFAGGLPAVETLPIAEIRQVVDQVLQQRGARALQYSAIEGIYELRALIAHRLSTPQLKITPDNILIVNGSQQGLDLSGRLLLDQGDQVVIENPSYLGMFMAWNSYGVSYLAAPSDLEGLQVEALSPLLEMHPKLMYLVPDFQNPQGTTLGMNKRLQLLALLRNYGVPLIEDSPYTDLRYEGKPIESLLRLDGQLSQMQHLDEGNVIHLGSFSKILAPGLRVGWVVAPPTVIRKMAQVKESSDLHTSPLSQWIAYELLQSGFVEQHLVILQAVYRERRDAMLDALQRFFPEEVHWTKPDGGFFVMVYPPSHLNATMVLREAISQQVAFVPGNDFHIGEDGNHTFRLSFSNTSPDQIEAGIQRLGQLLKQMLAEKVII